MPTPSTTLDKGTFWDPTQTICGFGCTLASAASLTATGIVEGGEVTVAGRKSGGVVPRREERGSCSGGFFPGDVWLFFLDGSFNVSLRSRDVFCTFDISQKGQGGPDGGPTGARAYSPSSSVALLTHHGLI